MKYTQVPADFELKLFASEPNIFKPIAMAWDERGRLWLAETRDYPNEVRPEGEGNDDIKICETDGDGVADKFTIFADHLNIPTSIVFANGGVIVAQAPNFLFQPTHGDDKADVRQVLFANCWGKNDTHAGPSNLHWGFDNWLYGAVGYAGFKSQSGPAQKFQQGIYRFRPDGSKIEFPPSIHEQHLGLRCQPSRRRLRFHGEQCAELFLRLARERLPARRAAHVREAHQYLRQGPSEYRESPASGCLQAATAAAGHMFMNSGTLPARFQGKALVCEPTCKLLSTRIFSAPAPVTGRSTTAISSPAPTNGCRLSPRKSDPMATSGSPIGTTTSSSTIPPQPGTRRLQSGNGQRRGPYQSQSRHGARPHLPARAQSRARWCDQILAAASSAELVGALASDNQFWRLTAQRLLVDGRKIESVPALRAVLKSAPESAPSMPSGL